MGAEEGHTRLGNFGFCSFFVVGFLGPFKGPTCIPNVQGCEAVKSLPTYLYRGSFFFSPCEEWLVWPRFMGHSLGNDAIDLWPANYSPQSKSGQPPVL